MGKHRDSKISPKIEKLLKDSVYHEEGVPGSARRCEKHMENLELAEHDTSPIYDEVWDLFQVESSR